MEQLQYFKGLRQDGFYVDYTDTAYVVCQETFQTFSLQLDELGIYSPPVVVRPQDDHSSIDSGQSKTAWACYLGDILPKIRLGMMREARELGKQYAENAQH